MDERKELSTDLAPERIHRQCLLDANIQALKEGSGLLALLSVKQYQASCIPVFQSTIGAHFRHLLEHYLCLFEQLDSGVFCYDARRRDARLELDRDYAARTISELSAKLEEFDHESFSRSFQLCDQIALIKVPTSLRRELLFLQSHSVHHYAIIAAMTRLLGEQPECEFGLAIATRTYLNNKARDDSKARAEADTAATGQASSRIESSAGEAEAAAAPPLVTDANRA